MRISTLFSSSLAVCAFATPTSLSPHVVHEKRSGSSGLRRTTRVDADSVTTFRLALKQSNLEHGEALMMNISHPGSPHYGQHWTSEQVRELFAPAEESLKAVQDWLATSGIERVSHREGWLSFQASHSIVERLLRTEFFEHEDATTGAVRVGCDE